MLQECSRQVKNHTNKQKWQMINANKIHFKERNTQKNIVFAREPSASILELHLNRCKKWTISSAKTSPKKTKLKRNLGIKKSKKHQRKQWVPLESSGIVRVAWNSSWTKGKPNFLKTNKEAQIRNWDQKQPRKQCKTHEIDVQWATAAFLEVGTPPKHTNKNPSLPRKKTIKKNVR